MADIVQMLLKDLGLYNSVPGTFPELITWIATVVIAAALLAGVIKTCFLVCVELSGRWRR